MAAFTEDVAQKIRDACDEIEKRKCYGMWFAGAREILPEVGPGWQDNLRQLLGGKPTNHARRIRNEPPRWVDDGLSFTNDGELKVYKTLKKIQATYTEAHARGLIDDALRDEIIDLYNKRRPPAPRQDLRRIHPPAHAGPP
jgi:hypothetical protein